MGSVRSEVASLAFVAVVALGCAFAQTGIPSSPPSGHVSTINVDAEIRDASGAVISGAKVRLESGSFRASAATDQLGRFAFVGVPGDSGTVEVEAEGFVAARMSFSPREVKSTNTAGAGVVHLQVMLRPSQVKEQVIVSAARTEVRLSDAPGSNILLSTTDLTASPAERLDDVLRDVPDFSLFRRSGSRTANASSQGFSLRGLGGTAASRALILADGISLIDPFGGWVYWDRIPRVAISTVEVVRGGGSNLYGSDALGGVVQVLMRQPETPAFSLETSYGNERTPELSFWTGSWLGKWDYSATTEMFRTDGYIVVPESLRGTIDVPANVENATLIARVGHDLGENGKIFLRGNYFTESRHNGTPLETNDTQIGEGAGGIEKQLGKDSVSVRIYGDVEGYDQVNSAVASNRDSETLTDIQHVPEQVAGGGAQWRHWLGKSQTLIAGMELNEVIGASVDRLFTGKNQGVTGAGRQRNLGWFGEDIFHRPKWTVILAARLDDWSNFAGNITTIPVSGTPTATAFPNRRDLAFDPRLSVLRTVNDHVAVTASVYRAFRAPLLNELYRSFRVGDIVTLNNPLLVAERLTGAEAGVKVTGWNRRLDLRGTFFWSDIFDPIENVTIAMPPPPAPIMEQKENLGRTRSRGVELDGALRVTRDWQFTAGYAYMQATVLSYPGNPGGIDLVGLDVPQVPRNVFTWEARYWNPARLFADVQGRFVGRAFDDDLNTLPLNAFYTMNFEVGRAITRHIEIFAAAENLTGQRYEVARTPTANLGPPILFRAGLRLNYPAGK